MQLEAHLRLCHNCFWLYGGVKLLSTHSAVNRSAANYYDLLGVKPDASLEQIKTAFFNKSKKLHPDSDPDNPALHSQFVELSEAYRVLSREASRQEYDLRLRHPYPFGSSPASGQTSSSNPSAETAERVRYWEQFRPAQENNTEDWEQKKKRNSRLVGYCVLAMLVSIGTHWAGFRKLEEVHNNFMDEKDRVITEIYRESKERARANGFKKQTELLRQKHAEFLEKYRIRTNGGDK
ncbi:dnaJ homolog subfamily C member 4-like [Denticeps clupeoides]|uniref:J domain-containing protein n=1 Tax=Denticeps clupeoides TaxID=299321 RepID=A0AAY4CGD5_9TELE|nr:dnaJ homolog subfamily C member 4-like [Denticeps clupeoides]XP_028822334.1 dnaJ homolog subfamily C member 4-like [Denticeps clupeoides]